jgi:hypothetical protein
MDISDDEAITSELRKETDSGVDFDGLPVTAIISPKLRPRGNKVVPRGNSSLHD